MLGTCRIAAARWPLTDEWVALEDGQGFVQLSVRALAKGERFMETAHHNAVAYRVSHSPGLAVLTHTQQDFPFFVLRLRRVSEFLGNVECPWNRHYKKAYLIFGHGPVAASLRAMTRATNAV